MSKTRILRTRFRIEAILAVIGGVLSLLTLVWPEWIETTFGAEPDNGSGETEWFIAVAFLAVAIVLALLARRDQRRLRALTATSST